MCSHFHAPEPRQLAIAFGAQPEGDYVTDLWPGYTGAFVRRHPHADAQDDAVPRYEVSAGTFGLLPFWAKSASLARSTYNARSETAAEKPSFRNAWKKGQRCIIPAQCIFEPDWRTGKAISTRIARADGELMGIAGLWEWRRPEDPMKGEGWSFTMLTVNASGHRLMENFHKPGDEKRMVAILSPAQFDEWLDAPVSSTMGFLSQYPADRLVATAG